MRRAARLGDGWMPYMYSPRRYAASVQTIRETAADAGRDLDGFEWYAYVFTNVDPDGDVAREQAARTIGGNYQQDVGPMIDSVAAAGTPDEVRAKLQAFVDAGARHFIFSPMGTNVRSTIDHLIGDVVPALHEYAASAAAAAGDAA